MNKTFDTKTLAAAAGLVLLLVGGATAAEDPQESFKALFGEQVTKVKFTATLADDVKLAGEIVQIAGSNKLKKGLLTVMYNTAFDLASRSVKGHATAFDAMANLSRAVSAEKTKCSQRSLMLHLKRFQMARRTADRKMMAGPYVQALMRTSKLMAADGNLDSAIAYSRKALITAVGFKLPGVADIRSDNSRLMAMRSAAKKRQVLETKLKVDPADAEIRKKLIELHLIDGDDPVAASKLLNDDCDEMLRTYVALAVKPLDKHEATTLSELGQWYGALAEKASLGAQAAMLRRTEGYYVRFLDIYAEKDAKRLRVSLALASVRRKLAKLGMSASESGGAVSSGSWPGSSRGLLFAWRDSSAMIKLTPRGKAHIAKDKSMSVGAGAFVAPGAINAKLLAACQKTNALTIEAMIKTDSLKQSGPARIISFSQDDQQRNFTVGQEDGSLVFRLRTTSSSDQNSTISLLKMSDDKWQHAVITYELERLPSSSKTAGRIIAYLNGRRMTHKMKKGGQLSGWASMHLLFGDEFADKRDWAGHLKNIAIYAR
ncbi:MAG: hypothetical protein QGG25_10040, partial [Phycisphaerae bacterium]|nr:hypothetical protein [Phycisphaerae bacterium]